MRRNLPLVLAVAVMIVASAEAIGTEGRPEDSRSGLDAFLEARILESDGRYREAVHAYDRALEAEPDVVEIRVRYAALLLELGLADRAVEVLDTEAELDWFGLRVRALALAQHAGRIPGALEDAERALRAAIEEREDDPNLQLSLAQVLHRQGELQEAEELIADLRRVRGDSPPLVAYHGSLLMALGRQQEAVEVYAECAATGGPAVVDCRENLVKLLVELGRPGEAGEVMIRWLGDDDLDQLMRAASLLYEGGRYEESLRTVRRVLRVAPGSVRAQTLEALLLSGLRRYEEASARLQVLQRRDRENLDILLSLAWATANTGDQQEARRWIGRAWELVVEDAASPDAVRVALAAARVELVGTHTSRAREWLDRVGDPEVAGSDLVYLLAETYRRDRAWSDGVAALLRLQPRLGPRARLEARAYEAEFRLRQGDDRAWGLLRDLLDSEDLREVLNGLQILQGLERWEDVDREAGAALERFPDSRDLAFSRAAALERLDRFDESEQLFQVLVEENPRDAAAANYLGYTWADRGRNLGEALELISRAVALDPENPAYLDSLGWIHYRLGDLDQAEHWLRRAVGLSGGDGTVLSHLGEVLFERGEIEEARTLLRRALELGCEHPEHVRGLLDRIDGAL